MADNGQMPMRRKREYGDAEKQADLLLALRDGVAAASEALNIPERTIYTWFERAGGLAEIRAFLDTAARVALSLAEQSVCEEVERRAKAGQLSDGELMATFRKLIEARSGPRGDPNHTGVVAVTRREIHIHAED